MADNRDGGFFHTLGAMIVGALIGGAIALLMAPKPGTELREELKQSASQAGDKLTEVSRQIAERAKDTWDEVSTGCCSGSEDTAIGEADPGESE